MSLLECSAEPEIYFQENWTQTGVDYPDSNFSYDGINSYISISYSPLLNTEIGGCRVKREGLCSVRCYHKTRKLSLKLADDVKEFFSNVALPKHINIGIGVDIPAVDLENDWHEATVVFDLTQY